MPSAPGSQDPTTSRTRCAAATASPGHGTAGARACWSCTNCRRHCAWDQSRSRSCSRRPVGLGGPASFNVAAIEAGEAVVAGTVGLVPRGGRRTVVWRAHPAERVPWVDERETAVELEATLADVTRRLVDLEVAAWQPEIPDLLLNLRHRAPSRCLPGTTPAGSRRVERAVLCLDIVELARAGDGGAVSAYEMDRRRCRPRGSRPRRAPGPGGSVLGPRGRSGTAG